LIRSHGSRTLPRRESGGKVEQTEAQVTQVKRGSKLKTTSRKRKDTVNQPDEKAGSAKGRSGKTAQRGIESEDPRSDRGGGRAGGKRDRSEKSAVPPSKH